ALKKYKEKLEKKKKDGEANVKKIFAEKYSVQTSLDATLLRQKVLNKVWRLNLEQLDRNSKK
ncbi:hypothetical protein RYX36_029641, partial [Vicia faba]